MREVAYLRVSTDEQAESGAGLRAQEDACRAHVTQTGAELVGPFADEGVSGAAPLDKRPGLLEALGCVRTGDILLVAKRDRLGRDPFVIAMIEVAVSRQGGRIISAAGQGTEDDEPESILMRRIVDAFGEFERLIIKARTRSALAAKKRRGQRTGSIPLGFALVDDGQRSKTGQPIALVPDVAEVATMELVRQLRAEGLPLRAIAVELDRRGIVPKKGAPRWSHSSVVRILDRITNNPMSPPVPTLSTVLMER